MSITDLFSKRRNRELGVTQDVYKYDVIPNPLRVQIIHIWKDSHGQQSRYFKMSFLFTVHQALCREYGKFSLTEDELPIDQLFNAFLHTRDNDFALDVIDLSFRAIDSAEVRANEGTYCDAPLRPDQAIAELNERFREHGIGYQFASGRLIRIDSEIIHSEVVKPALLLLGHKAFSNANAEFLSAHEHYRAGRYDSAVNECLKAFESTLKIICSKKKWPYDSKATVKPLIDIVFQNGLIAPFLQLHFTGLRTTLEGGVPTLRNKLTGHGKGEQSHTVPAHIAAYALHITAANIVMLVSAAEL